MRTPKEWFEEMRQIWLNKKPDLIDGLLAADVQYYENPFDPPLTKIADIVSVWQEIKEQNIERIDIDILHEDKNIGMATWRFKHVNQPEHTGSYFLKLDTQGKCLEFRQWWQVIDEDMPRGAVMRIPDFLPLPENLIMKEI